MKEDNRELAVVIGGSIFLIALLFLGSFWLTSSSCEEVEQMTGYQTRWKPLSGCYVHVNDRWIPLDAWRGEQTK